MTAFEPGASDVLTDRRHAQPARDGVPGEQPGADHHRRVGGVRAGRDRGDATDRSPCRDRHGRRPSPTVRRVDRASAAPPTAVVGRERLDASEVRRRRSSQQRPRSCGPARARPSDGRRPTLEVELQQRSSNVRAGAGLAPQALRLRVALDEVDPLGRPAGQAQVGERLVVDREQRRRRPELGAHVGDRRPVGERQRRPGRRRRTRRTRRRRRTCAASR